MRFPLLHLQNGGHRSRRATLAALGAALCALTPDAAQSQACVVGTLASYVNPDGPGGCTIGGVSLTWAQFGGISGNYFNALVTPLSGVNANGSYFGFRLTSINGGPLLSATIGTADAQVSNPNYDPNDGTQGPEFLPYLRPTERDASLSWRFNHSLTSPNAITRLELQTLGTQAASSSQQAFAPTFLPSGEPDVNTGCGWSIQDPDTGAQYDAAQHCAFFRGLSNNYLWREQNDNTIAQTVWQSSGEYQSPDYASSYCLENNITVAQTGADCTSFVDLTGTDFGTLVAFGLNQGAGAMRQFAPESEQGIFDLFNAGNLGALASVDQAEFRIYYQDGNTVVPEPGTWALMAVGLGGLLVGTRRRAAA